MVIQNRTRKKQVLSAHTVESKSPSTSHRTEYRISHTQAYNKQQALNESVSELVNQASDAASIYFDLHPLPRGSANDCKLIIPEEISQLTECVSITFNNSYASELPETLTDMKHIEYIDFSRNSIRQLPNNFSFFHLNHLNLSNNALSTIPICISSMPFLAHVNLSKNQITKLPFEGMWPGLKHIDLSHNQLEKIPSSLYFAEYLEELHAHRNSLTSLDIDKNRWCALQVLDVCHNKLSQLTWPNSSMLCITFINAQHNLLYSVDLPDTAKHLKHLDLGYNKLSSVPLSLTAIVSLTTLTLSYNPIVELIDAMSALQSLKVLDISSTYITEIPQSFHALSKLRRLTITNDKNKGGIDAEDETIAQSSMPVMASLRALDLRKSWLHISPDAIVQLASLNQLNCCFYPWKDELDAMFHNAKNLSLRAALIAGNRLQKIPVSVFDVQSITSLDISNNCIATLPATIKQLHQLKRLVAKKNALTTLPNEIANLYRLRHLDLDDNALSALPEAMFQLTLHTFYIKNNPLNQYPFFYFTSPLDHASLLALRDMQQERCLPFTKKNPNQRCLPLQRIFTMQYNTRVFKTPNIPKACSDFLGAVSNIQAAISALYAFSLTCKVIRERLKDIVEYRAKKYTLAIKRTNYSNHYASTKAFAQSGRRVHRKIRLPKARAKPSKTPEDHSFFNNLSQDTLAYMLETLFDR